MSRFAHHLECGIGLRIVGQIIPKGRTVGKYRYRKRTFLSPVSTGFTSYIHAEVESSEGGSYKYGNYLLTLADCRRRVELEFFLGNPRDRRRSLAKIDLLVEILREFREALKEEARLIAEAKPSGRASTKKKDH